MKNESRIIVDSDFNISQLDRRLFGSFVEHMGRCVYTGIFEPGHPTADANGFRGDVLNLVRELGPTIIRYPGGNYMSGCNWEDGVGPLESRPRRLDLAWMSTETNAFGTNEFITWCKLANIEPMLGVNLGTRGPHEAREYIEYCNHPGGTKLSNLRASHGFKEPHCVKFWCLGNEMDGPWQICRKTATEYGRIAAEAGKVMKWVDPSIVVSSCGSSARSMPTFGAWEYEVLDHTMDITDFVSLHMYYENPLGDVREFLANVEIMDHFIKETIAVCDAVAAKRKSLKRVMLSMDEWNVWYKARSSEHMARPGWPEAPPLIEEIYDLQDALMVGGALITLLNNADRVKVACQAQLVNVIGLIFAEAGGAAWRQTIFHPFKIVAEHAHGSVLEVKVQSDQHETKTAGNVDDIVAAAVHDGAKKKVIFFILNREANGPVEVSLHLRGFSAATGCTALTICDPNLLATNSAEKPNTIVPKEHNEFSVNADKVVAKLPPMSWNMLSVSY